MTEEETYDLVFVLMTVAIQHERCNSEGDSVVDKFVNPITFFCFSSLDRINLGNWLVQTLCLEERTCLVSIE